MSNSPMPVAMIEQTAGKGAARAAARRRARMEGAPAPGWVTYTILALVVLISVFPLYYAFLLVGLHRRRHRPGPRCRR